MMRFQPIDHRSPRGLTATLFVLALLVGGCFDLPEDPVSPLTAVDAPAAAFAGKLAAALPIHNLLGLPPDEAGAAEDINASDVIVGHWGERAWVWRRGGFRFLPSLGGEKSEAFALNNRGWTVGRSETSAGDFHATLWTDRGPPIDIGTPGGNTSAAADINASGAVAGTGTNAGGDDRAFVWKSGALRTLDPLPGDVWSAAYAINASGVIAGASCAATCAPVLWSGRGSRPREILLSGEGLALGINDPGQVVGLQQLPGGPIVGFLWQRGKLQSITHPTNPALRVDAAAINNRGTVVGSVDNGAQAFAWKSGEMKILESLGGASAEAARGINNKDIVVGRSSLLPGGLSLAALWAASSPWRFWSVDEVGVLPGSDESEAHDINDAGEVVGVSFPMGGGERAFLFDGTMNDLGDLGGGGARALAINSSTQITGSSVNSNGDSEAFIWQASVMTGLAFVDPIAPFPFSRGEDINNDGWVVGQSGVDAFLWAGQGPMGALGHGTDFDSRAKGVNTDGIIAGTSSGPASNTAVQWNPGAGPPPFPSTVQALSNLNAHSRANGINDFGQIVGFFDGSNSKEAYVWDQGTVTTFFKPSTISEADAINKGGRVVGTGGIANTFAFAWENGWIFLLPSFGGAPNGETGNGLNDSGQVVGSSKNGAGERRAVVWTRKP